MSDNKEAKTAEEIIRENESVYLHEANEASFDCEMVDMSLNDAIKHIQEHATAALTAYRAEVLSIVDQGGTVEDILKIDINEFGK